MRGPDRLCVKQRAGAREAGGEEGWAGLSRLKVKRGVPLEDRAWLRRSWRGRGGAEHQRVVGLGEGVLTIIVAGPRL